ncbi:hypothetical protein [Nevskia ramosa]|uniref:hypothetical protein n=1 Tax=Nevskia ramosa TaxID=64002 RepID=UPI0003B45195|nr:hypothetical protein [Nevskia ramosa]
MNMQTANAVARRTSPIAIAAVIVTALLLGCGKPAEPKPAAAEPGKLRAELNVGYSLLYQQADGIPKMKWILMFKDKGNELDQTATGMMEYYKQLAQSMEQVAAKNPALRLDAVTMPDILVDTRKAIGIDMAKDFAPLVGNSGVAFERELVLMFYNALDEQRHLVGVMIEREPEPGLKSFLEKTRTQLEGKRSKLEDLLNRRYFKQ